MVEWYRSATDTSGLLPDCLNANDLFQQLSKAIDVGIDDLKAYSENVVNNCYVLTADSDLIDRYEKIFSLSSSGLSLDARRSRVVSHLCLRPPVNEVMLKAMMSGILGEIVKVESVGDYSIVVKYREQTGYENVEYAKILIRKIVPANLELEIVYAYVEWQNILKFLWSDIKNYTWQQIMSSNELM